MGAVSRQRNALEVYDRDGYQAYIYQCIADAHTDERNAMMSGSNSLGSNVPTQSGGRIAASSLKEFKYLVRQLSKPGSQLTKTELNQLTRLTEQFGGKLRMDMNPIKGKTLQPHVQVEGLGSSVSSRHIWLAQ
jgi:hypothetical protein